LKLNDSYRVIISGGGTGGHIFPALAIANEMKKRNPQNDILFVGSKHRMEMNRIPEAGYKIIGINISGFQRKKLFVNLSLPLKVMACLVRCAGILRKYKPQIAIGVGGYVSGPLLLSAVFNGIPTLIQEQNSYAGITNKILARYVDKVCVAYNNMEKYFPKEKIILTGNPVKNEMLERKPEKSTAIETFHLRPEFPVIFISGGSLGARTLNLSVLNALDEIYKANVQLIWQTGERPYEEMVKLFENRMEEIVKKNGVNYNIIKERVKIVPFIKNMHQAYSASDVVVSRAGALTLAEICTVKIPCILVPSPNVAEDHQTKNAEVLIQKGAGWLIKDKDAQANLIKKAMQLAFDEFEKGKMINNQSGIVPENAAEKIVNEVEKLISERCYSKKT